MKTSNIKRRSGGNERVGVGCVHAFYYSTQKQKTKSNPFFPHPLPGTPSQSLPAGRMQKARAYQRERVDDDAVGHPIRGVGQVC